MLVFSCDGSINSEAPVCNEGFGGLLIETQSPQSYGPVREKTNNLEFRPGPTQTDLYSH